MKNLSLVKTPVPDPEPVLEGEIVHDPPPSAIEQIPAIRPVSLNAFGWIVGLALGVGFIAGAALTETSFKTQTEAKPTRRKTRRR